MNFDAIREQLQTREPQMLVCYCCGVRYARGSFRCCAAPNGMPSHEWAQGWCAPPKEGGCGKCERHCECHGRPAPVTSLSEWLARARRAVENKSVAEIFEEGERS